VTDEKDPKDEKDEKDESEASEKESEAVTAPDKKEVEEKAETKSEPKKAEKKAEKKADEKKAEDKDKKKKPKDKEAPDPFRIAPSNPVAGAWKTFAGMGLVGVVGSGVAYSSDHTRMAYAWLFGFICALTIAIGAIMFVIMHHLASGSWGIVVRRVAEVLGASSWVLVLLIIPVLVLRGDVFHQWLHTDGHAAKEHAALTQPQDPQDPHDLELAANDLQPRNFPHGGMRFQPHFQPHGGHPGGMHGTPIHMRLGSNVEARALHVEHEEVMKSKAWFLNQNFFFGRLLFYFFIWYLLGHTLLKWSTDQDKSKDPLVAVKLRKFAAAGAVLLSFTLTFAAFDWIMTLDPTWYSTIFGVTFFASSMVCIFALLILIFLGMRQSGVLVKEVTVEHYHDLGKLLFGFMCFWAYVCFSQFMLIWYAALPEEVTFYHHRWDVGPWKTISLAIVLLHFMFPFVFIMSRNIKRNLPLLRVGAILLLTMHVIDMYWLVLPNVPHQTSFAPSWIDVFGFMGPVGIFLAVAFRRLLDFPIVPVGDPRLQRSIHFLNA
jgi:hypothetical protein